MSSTIHNRLVDVRSSDNEDLIPVQNSNMRSQEATIETSPQQQAASEGQQQTFKLSKQRWLVLFAMTLYGLISAGTGEFSSILSVMLELLELPLDNYIYIGQLFMYFPAVCTLPTTWFIDRYGFRMVMYVATLFMLIRSAFRALMFYPDFPNWERFKIIYWILSGVAASQSASIFFCMPLKISEDWFAESERSIAWTVMLSSYSIGTTLAASIFPRIIHRVSDVKPLAYLNFVSGIILAIVVALCITRSKPNYPPSARKIKSSAKKSPWLVSIRKVFGQRDIILHILHELINDSMAMATFTVIQDILTTTGHSKIFAGNLIAINSLLSVILLMVLASFVHRVTDITTTCKVASVIRTVIFIVHLLTMLYPNEDWIILTISVAYTICRSWASPNMNNMTAHIISGTISEATIAGLATTLYVVLMSLGQVAFMKLVRTDDNGKHDYTDSFIMACTVCVVNSLIYITLFRGQPAKDELGGSGANRNPVQNISGSHDNQAFDRETEES